MYCSRVYDKYWYRDDIMIPHSKRPITPELRSIPPDYILAMPVEDSVPEVQASCDKEDLDDLKLLKVKGMYIYKLIGGKA